MYVNGIYRLVKAIINTNCKLLNVRHIGGNEIVAAFHRWIVIERNSKPSAQHTGFEILIFWLTMVVPGVVCIAL